MIQSHTHSIQLEFSSKGFLLLRVTIPLKLKPVVSLSKFYESTKAAVASSHELPVWKIKGSHKKIESKIFDRILYEFTGGYAVDLPDNCTTQDYKIILHYLEGVRMAIKA